jgi:hypothetical protein
LVKSRGCPLGHREATYFPYKVHQNTYFPTNPIIPFVILMPRRFGHKNGFGGVGYNDAQNNVQELIGARTAVQTCRKELYPTLSTFLTRAYNSLSPNQAQKPATCFLRHCGRSSASFRRNNLKICGYGGCVCNSWTFGRPQFGCGLDNLGRNVPPATLFFLPRGPQRMIPKHNYKAHFFLSLTIFHQFSCNAEHLFRG